MSTLAPLIPKLPPGAKPLQAVQHIPFHRLVADSRQVMMGDVFLLLKSQDPNAKEDKEALMGYIKSVKDRAAFVICEYDWNNETTQALGVSVVCVPFVRQFLGDMLRYVLFDDTPIPPVVAVTGTNGKTTISQLVAQLVALAGKQALVLGTAGNGLWPVLSPSTHTTLQVTELFYALHKHKNADVVALEASSHGLHQGRLQGVPVTVAIFSNLSQDHLDYHRSMEEYAGAKARLFGADVAPSDAIINIDDPFGKTLTANVAKDTTVWRYSLTDPTADFFAKDIEQTASGSRFRLVTPKGVVAVDSPLLGHFNVANVVASMAAVWTLGFDLSKMATQVGKLQGAKGRMQQVPSSSGQFMVDYAHTPDALEQVLVSLRGHCVGRLWVVFGCGGDRDKTKRPLMADIAIKHADGVVFTSDNPRFEAPEAILADMTANLTGCAVVIPNREEAIFYAVEHACDDDVVVVAGKGHETYQEINGVRYDFDDVQVLTNALTHFGKEVL